MSPNYTLRYKSSELQLSLIKCMITSILMQNKKQKGANNIFSDAVRVIAEKAGQLCVTTYDCNETHLL